MREVSNSEIAALIDEWIHSERDRKILKRRLIDGIRFEPLAEEFDMSVRQIKNIVREGSTKVFSHARRRDSMGRYTSRRAYDDGYGYRR